MKSIGGIPAKLHFLFYPSFRPSRCRLKVSIKEKSRKSLLPHLGGKTSILVLSTDLPSTETLLPPPRSRPTSSHRSFRFFTPLSIDPRLVPRPLFFLRRHDRHRGGSERDLGFLRCVLNFISTQGNRFCERRGERKRELDG